MIEAGDTRLPERFWRRVQEQEGGCWLWVGTVDRGYGLLSVDGKTVRAHRYSYETLVGPIPDGLQIDHLCRNRGCVNPAHLEPVTQVENIRRGDAAKLAVEDVPKIRERIIAGDALTAIAADYGVGFEVIFTVAEDERWRDDPSAPRRPLRPDVRCPVCDTPITEGRRNRRYCSQRCISKADYARSARGQAAAVRRAAKNLPRTDLTKEQNHG